ncbi:hypothetical protein CEUSTIGMA_g4938.t1 [Chlamydomonas eustigma]|uniref:Uncharacterized protein n=1 Tax=Chlamydomonas eustigma TaxID=1157962 RepID=A0A250X334_9CHLO|nr:hypothetical protein CEUSTIGMA_g4938.t1 [Chlamydomonas eustigma]|eukprot:GAX77494.1 hypothetical protein CEUSTIGMA_g4938.t1 [Chlamydomonas eustigma]
MTWSDEVHTFRLIQALAQARADRALRRKGLAVPVPENANLLTAAFLLTASSCAVLAKRYADRLKGVQWAQLPILKQFHDLIRGDSGTKLNSKPKSKSSTKSKGRSKAASSASIAPPPSAQNVLESPTVSAAGQASPAAPKANLVQRKVVDATGPTAPQTTRKPSGKGSKKSKKK